jgi:hypothetical protein
MKRIVSVLEIVELVVAVITVLTGWVITIWQLDRNGWIADGGTVWLFTFCVVATFGAALAYVARRNGWHTLTAVALIVVATSPTFYLIEIFGPILLVLVVFEIGTAIRIRHQQSARVIASSVGVKSC